MLSRHVQLPELHRNNYVWQLLLSFKLYMVSRPIWRLLQHAGSPVFLCLIPEDKLDFPQAIYPNWTWNHTNNSINWDLEFKRSYQFKLDRWQDGRARILRAESWFTWDIQKLWQNHLRECKISQEDQQVDFGVECHRNYGLFCNFSRSLCYCAWSDHFWIS